VVRELHEPQAIVNVAWSYATLSHDAPGLFQLLARHAMRELARFTPQGLTTLLWSFAAVNVPDAVLLDACFERLQLEALTDQQRTQLQQVCTWCELELLRPVPTTLSSLTTPVVDEPQYIKSEQSLPT
jgi:hypothetical protein